MSEVNGVGGPLVPVPRGGGPGVPAHHDGGHAGAVSTPRVTIHIQTSPLPRGPLPAIEVSGRQLRDVSDDAIDAIVNANDPPRIFKRGGILVRLERDEGGAVVLRPLVGKALRNHLARVADWFRCNHPVAPPSAVVGDI